MRVSQLNFPFQFDEVKAHRVCEFTSHLRHTQGPLAGERIKLENWQCWVLTEVFGWIWGDTGTRRYKRAYVEIPRGNGKTLLASAIGMYTAFVEGEPGADCICAATSIMQSRLCLDTARTMVSDNELLRQKLGLRVLANSIQQPRSNSRFRVLPAKSASLEGMAVHAGVIDELHLHKNRNVFDSISTACAKRQQSLLWIITTAGYDRSGVCYELHDFAERLLEASAQDESYFAVIYTCDPDDDIFAESTLRKANPNWGISVDIRAVLEEATRARQIPSQRESYRMRYLCEWTANDGTESFLDFPLIQKCYDPALSESDFANQPAVLAADFASKCDLCSAVRVHARVESGKTHYFVFVRNWLPSDAIKNNPSAVLTGWVESGQLISTPGGVVDFDAIEESLFEWWSSCKVRDFNYDPMQAQMLVTHLKRRTEAWDSFVEISQFAKNMSDGMNLLQEAVVDGRLHTNSHVLLWCLTNLRHRRVGLHFITPIRPQDRNKKIDAAVALVMALKSLAIVALDDVELSPYANRGFIILDPNYKWPCEWPDCKELTNRGKYCPEHTKTIDQGVVHGN